MSFNKNLQIPVEEYFMRSFTQSAPLRRVPAFLFLLLLFLFSTPLFADDEITDPPVAAEKPVEDDAPAADQEQADVVVTATRKPDESLVVPPFVITISRDLIEASGKARLSETVAENAGAALYAYGAKGSLEQLILRGAMGKNILVLIDGIPTNNVLDGQMDLELIPMEVVDRLEIIQGGMSLLYGSSAVGGVINIITRRGDTINPFFSAALSATSYLPQEYADGGSTIPPQANALLDGGSARLGWGNKFGPLGFFISGNFDWLRNEYYYDNFGTTEQRNNAGLIGGGGAASISLPWETGVVHLTGLYMNQQSGVPGDITLLFPEAKQTDERLQLLAGYHEDNFLSEIFNFDAKVSFTHQLRIYDNPTFSFYTKDYLTSFFGELSQKADIADWLSFIYGGNASFDLVTGDSLDYRDRFSGSIFLSTPLSFADTVRIFPAGRLDISSDYGSEFTYGLGVSFIFSKYTSLKLSFAKSFRAPNFGELYYPGASNPSLHPERGWHGDLVFSLKTKHVSCESGLFIRYMEEEIASYPPLYIPYNTEQSLYPGAEMQIRIELIEHFFIDASYTFIYSYNLGGGRTITDDDRVPRLPLHEGHLYLSYKTDTTVIRLGGDIKSEWFTDNTYSTTVPAHIVLNANLRQQLTDFLILTIALDNILNTQYQLVYNYPMPGISLRWGLELKL